MTREVSRQQYAAKTGPLLLRRPDLKEHATDICEKYEDGASTTELARGYGTTHRTIADLLRKNGVYVRSPAEGARLSKQKAVG